ncbi:MAG: 2-C-methyl-D-erythritol 4-phosphate cytidylyltransferase, partial [Planctomycetes bacterium]|nr:2-C-methyl-D-erythritol 4-phosphate cytidylyltransferase [Planctomycetota bacterium]
MAKFSVILPAAGRSSRFGGALAHSKKKVFVELKGRPVWVRSAEAFVNRDDVIQVLVVVAPEDLEWFREKFLSHLAFMNIEVVTGGDERADSVRNALAKVHSDAEYVAVHDAARPLIVKEWIDRVFRAAEGHGAALLATPVTSTLKQVTNERTISQTVPRNQLWAAQTPQVFRREWLVDAYAKQKGLAPTDEAQLVEQAGYAVHVVEGSAMNIKITTQEDFRMAEVLLDILP